MPATTPGGFPYVLPTDHPLEYPTHSQQLALAIDAGLKSTWTPASGMADLAGNYTGLFVTREGPLVTVEGTLKPTADAGLTVGTSKAVGTIPAGYRPAKSHIAAGIVALSGNGSISICRLTVDKTTGAIDMLPTVAGTMTAASGWVGVLLTYRGA